MPNDGVKIGPAKYLGDAWLHSFFVGYVPDMSNVLMIGFLIEPIPGEELEILLRSSLGSSNRWWKLKEPKDESMPKAFERIGKSLSEHEIYNLSIPLTHAFAAIAQLKSDIFTSRIEKDVEA